MSTAAKVAIGAGVTALLVGLIVFLIWEVEFLNAMLLAFTAGGWIFTLMVVVVGVLALLARASDSPVTWGATITAGVLSVIALIVGGVFGAYWADQEYLKHVQVAAADTAPAFNQRPALVVARNQVQSQTTTVGDQKQSAYIPGLDRFTTLISSKDAFKGYTEIVSQKVGLTGQSTKENCRFSQYAGMRLDGNLYSDLSRWVAQTAGYGTFWNADDAYGYCDGDTPMVVVPLLKQEGFWPVIEAPNGIALYNGSTGALQVLHGDAAAKVPGPTAPESYAKRLREATVGMGDFWQHAWGNIGFDDTHADGADPNGENRSEFVLSTTDGHTVFVTPLTRKGASTGISAIGVATATSGNDPADLTIYTYPDGTTRKSNSAAVDQIRAQFGDLPWASGLQVFEITPVTPQEWVASIGLKQNVTHRVRLAFDGSACLETANGTKLKCIDKDGNTTFGGGTTTPTDPGTPVSPTSDLSKLTNEQLAQLANQVNAEIVRRLQEKK